jgi:hypothetical protein
VLYFEAFGAGDGADLEFMYPKKNINFSELL